ncbi:MAG: hypothetical protein HY288_12860 [Planctomycetia bacterium]|nr:hypothetical protein [Planctomycetia bacterium]
MDGIIEPCTPAVAPKVAYEIRMFRYTSDRLRRLDLDLDTVFPDNVSPRVGTGISTEEVREASMVLESFLVHTRVLRDFFWRGRSRPDDVVAGDFVGGWKMPSDSEYSYLFSHKDRLDKALAHLTTARVTYDSEGKGWAIREIENEIEPMIERFLRELPEDRRYWFELP